MYLVDASTDEIVEIARIEAPEQLRTSFRAHLTGWKGERVFVQLSGCPESECYGDLVQFRYFELRLEEMPRRIDSRPENTEHVSGMLARAPGEEVYMRVSAGSQLISVRTEASESFVDRYKIESSGGLVETTPDQPMQPNLFPRTDD